MCRRPRRRRQQKPALLNDLLPERFGREREYALGKTSGKANIKKNLEALGIELSESDILKVTERIISLGDKKEIVTQDDLPFIVADVLKHQAIPSKVRVDNYALSLSQGLHPTATVKLVVDGAEFQESAVGDGQFDAFMRAVRRIYNEKLRRTFPTLANYTVNIPPAARPTLWSTPPSPGISRATSLFKNKKARSPVDPEKESAP